MISEEISYRIAKKLSGLWELHRLPEEFKAYINRVYHRTVGTVPTFDCLFVAECEEGDSKKGSLGDIISRLWKVDDTGTWRAQKLHISENEDDEFYNKPMVRFFLDGDKIVTGERLGPQYVSRRVGLVRFLHDELELSELKTLWTSDTL